MRPACVFLGCIKWGPVAHESFQRRFLRRWPFPFSRLSEAIWTWTPTPIAKSHEESRRVTKGGALQRLMLVLSVFLDGKPW